MRNNPAIVLISLAILPTSLFAQEARRLGVALNDMPVVVATAVDGAFALPSSNASVRSRALRDAMAREVARVSQTGTPPSSQPVAARGWIARHPVQGGFWIGAAAGAVVGSVSCANAPEFAGLCMAGGLAAGGGAGAYGGLVASAVSDRRHGRPLSMKTKGGLVAGTAGLLVIGISTRGTFTW